MQQYLDLLKAIQERGTYKPAARENMPGTQSLFGYQFRHDLANGFPLLTTKKMFWKGVVVELLWFLRGDTNIKYLVDNGVNIWNEDAYQYYCKIYKQVRPHIQEMLPFEEFIDFVKNPGVHDWLKTPFFDNSTYHLGDCGYQYGKQWRKWQGDAWCVNFEHLIDYHYIDQIKNLIAGLKETPESRRHIVSVIDPAHDNDLALFWCHAMFQMNCRPLTDEQREEIMASKGYGYPATNSRQEQFSYYNIPKYYLDCYMYQRSADAVLGVPFNVASYALLTHILSEICNMVPGELITSYGDLHIYDNHKEAVEEQLKRTPTALPKLRINTEFWNPENVMGETNHNVINGFQIDDFQIEDYNPQPPIKAKLSTGL